MTSRTNPSRNLTECVVLRVTMSTKKGRKTTRGKNGAANGVTDRVKGVDGAAQRHATTTASTTKSSTC